MHIFWRRRQNFFSSIEAYPGSVKIYFFSCVRSELIFGRFLCKGVLEVRVNHVKVMIFFFGAFMISYSHYTCIIILYLNVLRIISLCKCNWSEMREDVLSIWITSISWDIMVIWNNNSWSKATQRAGVSSSSELTEGYVLLSMYL